MTNQHATDLSLLPTQRGTGLTRKNVIVLTHGWTGSSIFSALFGEAGYWLGGETVVKPDYDTFENADLVALNNRLLHELAPALNHEHQFLACNLGLVVKRGGNRLVLKGNVAQPDRSCRG